MKRAGTPALVLASRSPRRRALLRDLGIRTRILAPPEEIERAIPRSLPPGAYARAAARAKALWAAAHVRRGYVLAADTVVVIDGVALGKPGSRAEAGRMLRALSGRAHEVLTAVAVGDPRTGALHEGEERTTVRFVRLSTSAIDAYVASGEPADKAGAYAVQGRGALFIAGIDGSWSNVVGLPLRTVARLLCEAGAGGLLPLPWTP